MVELSEESALAAKSVFTLTPAPIGMYELDGDRTFESTVYPPGAPDAPHAATTDLGFDEVRTQPAPD